MSTLFWSPDRERVQTMKRYPLILAVLLAAGPLFLAGLVMAPQTAEAAKGEKLSKEIQKPLKAAQDAMSAQDWDTALASIQEAQAVEPKSPYEAFMVDELGWYVYMQKQQYAEAAPALERALASGYLAPEDVPQRTKVLAQFYYQSKNYDKAIEAGEKYLAMNPGDAEMTTLVVQAYYLKQDYAGTKSAIQRLTPPGQVPKEQLLLLSLKASYEADDKAGTTAALRELVRYYPQQKYWEDLLNTQLFRTKGDRELRALYRLMDETSTLDKPDEYSEMGAVLVSGGYPTEAKRILERGFQTNVLAGEAGTRAKATLDRATSGAAADTKEIPGAAQALASAKTGNEMVTTGKLYFSVGDYTKAADAFRKGLAAGGVTDMDDANVLLGIALVRSGALADSVSAFSAVKDPALAEVADLWKLYVAGKTAPPPAAPEPPTVSGG